MPSTDHKYFEAIDNISIRSMRLSIERGAILRPLTVQSRPL
jgi:hypothetical protein